MKDQNNLLFEKLAEKLGTTTEYLWQILIKQAFVDSTITLIQVILVILFGFFLYKKHKQLCKEKEYTPNHLETGYSYYGEKAIFPMYIGAAIFVILIIISFCLLESIYNGFFNPEYWALNKALESLRPQ